MRHRHLLFLIGVLAAAPVLPQPSAKSEPVIVIRAGVLIDGASPAPRRDQAIVIRGNHIESVDNWLPARVPAGAHVIDLSRATVLPGLIDAHTHMFNNPKPGMSREASTLIAVQNLQADLRAGFTAARDMTSHGNGYADVDIRNAINEGRLDGPRFQVAGRGIMWGAAPAAEPANQLS